jgi:hypothetical protein
VSGATGIAPEVPIARLNPMREDLANKSDTPQPLTPDDPDGCTAGCTDPAPGVPESPPSPLLALLYQLLVADRARLAAALQTNQPEGR